MLAPRKNMDDFLMLLRQKYGGAEGYIKNLGFTNTDISVINIPAINVKGKNTHSNKIKFLSFKTVI